MVMDMLTIYLHYEDENQEAHILQRSMMKRHVLHYDFILMIEEVGSNAVDFLYYAKKNPQGRNYFVHIDDPTVVNKMLSDPEIEKAVHLYVSKEKVTDDIAPSDHPNENVRLHDGVVSAEGAKQLIVRSSQRKLRRSKRLNVIQVTGQHNDEDGDFNNGEQHIAPGDESQALEDEEDQVHNQLTTQLVKRKRTSLPIVWNMQPGQRIVVKCNEEGQPIGERGAILGKFLGTTARIGGLCPLNINDWRDLKKNSREETILQCVQRQADPEKKQRHRSTVYLATHKKKDNAESKEKNERLARLEDIIAQRPASAQNVNGRVTWEGDALHEVLGEEKAGQEIMESNNNVISRPVLHGKTKRVQFNEPVEARSSMQHGMSEDRNDGERDNVSQDGEHDNANQLLIQRKPLFPQDPAIDSVLEVRETRDRTYESFARLDQQGTKNKRSTKRRRTSSLEVGSKVVLKTSTYPNKRTVAYATIRSTDPATKAGAIELGVEFTLVRKDESILDNEELVREVYDCKTIGDAFTEGFCIAWPSAFIRNKDN